MSCVILFEKIATCTSGEPVSESWSLCSAIKLPFTSCSTAKSVGNYSGSPNRGTPAFAFGQNSLAEAMYRSPKYPTTPDEVEDFVASMRQGTIVATPPGGHPQVSILPFVKTGDEIELHFVQRDPTFAALQANPSCTFLVSDFLAFTPHDFVDPVDGGRATLHFRAVAFECEARHISTEASDVAGALGRLLAHHEPGANYEPIGVGEFYGARLAMLGTARLSIVNVQAKFKVGPAATAEVRQGVADRLRARAEPGDERAADVIEDYLRR